MGQFLSCAHSQLFPLFPQASLILHLPTNKFINNTAISQTISVFSKNSCFLKQLLFSQKIHVFFKELLFVQTILVFSKNYCFLKQLLLSQKLLFSQTIIVFLNNYCFLKQVSNNQAVISRLALCSWCVRMQHFMVALLKRTNSS